MLYRYVNCFVAKQNFMTDNFHEKLEIYTFWFLIKFLIKIGFLSLYLQEQGKSILLLSNAT